MKPAAPKPTAILALAFCLVACVFATPAHAATRALFAWGTNDYFWSADVNPVPPTGAPTGVLTTIRVRSAGDQLRWRNAGELSETPVSVSNRGSELLIVLDDGEWKIVSENDVRSGIALPNNGQVRALAGDGDDIWAIGGIDPTRAPATARATTHASTSNAPAESRPIATSAPGKPPHPLALFRLHSGAWTQVADAPVDFKPEQAAAISLAMLDSKLTLAIVGPDRAIRLFTRTADHWSTPIEVGTLNDNAQMKLLDVRGRPALWVADGGSAGALYFASEGWTKPVKLIPSALLDGFDCRSLAVALGQLRLLATDGKGRIKEQLYEPDGKLLGDASEAITGPTDVEKRVGDVIKFIVMAALIAWMLGSLRQRPNMADVIRRVDSLHIAPMSRRVIGGAIDLLPLIVGCLVSSYFASQNTEPAAAGPTNFASPEIVSVCTGVGLYFLHVTLLELLTGRSLGKWITGTRVASLDGTPAKVSQLLARNALRLIDLILLGVPLLSTIQSPLRQRVGDMTAGTIVVLNDPPVESEATTSKPESDSPSDPPPPQT